MPPCRSLVNIITRPSSERVTTRSWPSEFTSETSTGVAPIGRETQMLPPPRGDVRKLWKYSAELPWIGMPSQSSTVAELTPGSLTGGENAVQVHGASIAPLASVAGDPSPSNPILPHAVSASVTASTACRRVLTSLMIADARFELRVRFRTRVPEERDALGRGSAACARRARVSNLAPDPDVGEPRRGRRAGGPPDDRTAGKIRAFRNELGIGY